MSGHSKWAQIKRKKALTDTRKGQLFSKLSKIIELASRKGADVETNFSLKAVVDQARATNMPSSNIEKAIEKGSGKSKNSGLEEIVYEAYGPGGVALLIVTVTDNKNRTVSEIKHILSKGGGNLTGTGSVKWLFDSKLEDGKVVWTPKHTLTLGDEDESKLSVLLSDLDDQEDVSDVYTNSE
jgi:YebC/PmpR family DNA-binding regulatory protein